MLSPETTDKGGRAAPHRASDTMTAHSRGQPGGRGLPPRRNTSICCQPRDYEDAETPWGPLRAAPWTPLFDNWGRPPVARTTGDIAQRPHSRYRAKKAAVAQRKPSEPQGGAAPGKRAKSEGALSGGCAAVSARDAGIGNGFRAMAGATGGGGCSIPRRAAAATIKTTTPMPQTTTPVATIMTILMTRR